MQKSNRAQFASSPIVRFKSCTHVLLLIFCWLAFGQCGRSSEMVETDSFDEVVQKVTALADRHGPGEVLLVCDIDNTILAMNQGLGSVAWFDNQMRLLRENPESEELVGRDLESILRVQGILFTLGRMHPPEKTIPDRIAELQKKGVYTLCLTSRGPKFRNATEESLRRNRYNFAQRSPQVIGGFRGETIPYRQDSISSSGISREESKRFRLGNPRPVSYDKGIFMTSGQNKGAMLLMLLARCPRRFSAIVFVDDKEDHIKDVFTAVVARNIEIVAVRYSREDRTNKIFNMTGREKAQQQWKKLRKTLNEVFQ